MIGRSGERGSEISVLAARHDDDDERSFQCPVLHIYIYIYIYIYILTATLLQNLNFKKF